LKSNAFQGRAAILLELKEYPILFMIAGSSLTQWPVQDFNFDLQSEEMTIILVEEPRNGKVMFVEESILR
jgi:hypothetical protein